MKMSYGVFRWGSLATALMALALTSCSKQSVVPVSVASVAISPSSLSLLQGESQTLRATPMGSGGQTLSGRSVTWSSDAPSIATVDSAGTVEGVAVGNTTIRANVEGVTGTVPVTVLKGQSIQLSSTAIALNAMAGNSSGTQTDTVTNGGGGVLSGLSTSITYAAQGPSGWLTATLADTVAPTALSITASAASLGTGSYSATITVRSPVRGGLSAQVAVTLDVVPAPPDVAVIKTGPATATAGAQVTYDIAVTQVGGTSGASGVVLKDSLPTALAFDSATGGGTYSATSRVVTWSVGNLSLGGSKSVQLVATVGTGVSGAVSNTATVSSAGTDPNTANDTSTVITTVGQNADLSVTKTAPATAVAGTLITDTIRVRHVSGTSDATGVVLTDTLPAALTFVSATGGGTYNGPTRTVTWSLGTVAPGDSAVVAVTTTVGAGVSGSVTNTATVVSTSADPNMGNNTSKATTTVSQTADVAVVKTAPAAAVAGAQVSYTIAVSQVGGPSDASGVVVKDSLPTALTYASATSATGTATYNAATRTVTWNVGTVAVGASDSLVLVATVGSGVSGSVTNTATVSSTSTDTVTSNDTSTVTTPVTQGADVAVTKTGPATATAGTSISYTIGVSHVGGTSNASGVVVTDTLPSSLTFDSATAGGTYNATSRVVTWSVGTLTVGASTTFGLTATVGAGVSGVVNNTAAVSSTSTDPNTVNDTATASTTVGQTADLSVTKTAPATAIAGAQITDTIRVRHVSGTSSASGVVVTDTLPGSLTYVNSTGGTSSSAAGQVATWNLGTVAVGDSAILTVTATVGAGVSGVVNNRAWVGSTSTDPVLTNDSSTATTTVTQSADVAVTKTAPDTAVAGAQITYTIAVSHVSGTSNASGVVVRDTVPSSLTSVAVTSATGAPTYNSTSHVLTWNVGTLAVGVSDSLSLTATVGAGVSGALSNRAWVSSTSTDPVSTNDSSTVTTTVVQGADVAVTKTGPATATAGGPINYTITVKQVGGTSNASGVVVTDTLPAGLTYFNSTGGTSSDTVGQVVTWTVGNLAVGTSQSLGLAATVGAGVSGVLSNRAWVSSTSTDPVSTNDSSTATTTVGQTANLAVLKTGPKTAAAGTSINYAIGVSYVAGTSDASGVTVVDTLPAGLTYTSSTGGTSSGAVGQVVTWNVGTLAVGGSASLGLTVKIDPTTSGSVNNRAWVSSAATDPVITNDSSTASTTVSQSADLSVKKTGPATAASGDTITYNLAVANGSTTSGASGVTVVDTLPAGLTYASTTGGTSVSVSGQVVTWTIGAMAASGTSSTTVKGTTASTFTGALTNRAWVSSTSTDPVATNDSSAVTTTVSQSADLSITKTGPATAASGDTITYDLAVANGSTTSGASGVTVVDTLPTGLTYASTTGGTSVSVSGQVVTWTIGAMATSGTSSLTVKGTTASTFTGALTNRAWVSSTSTDPVATNDSSAVTTTVSQSADLSITKTGPATALSGDTVTYDLAVANLSKKSGASGVTVVDTLPTGLTYSSSTGTPSPTVSGQVLTWTIGTMAANGTSSFTVKSTTASTFTGTLTNRAWVNSNTDPVLTNDSSTVTTTVSQSADLSVTKTGPANASSGSSITYTLGVANLSTTSGASGVTVVDTLPAGLTYASSAGGTGSSAAGQVVTWTIGAMGASGTSSLTVTGTTASTFTGTLTNRAWVSSTSTDPVATNDSSAVTTTVSQSADLSITKTGPATAASGDTITYNLAVANGSTTSGASGVTVVDTLPTGLTYASTTGGTSVSVSGQVVTWTIGAMATSGTSSLTVKGTTAPTFTGALTNRAWVGSTSTDPVATNDSSAVTTTVSQSANLSITKTAPVTAVAGTQITDTIHVYNSAGPSDASQVVVTDTLPDSLTFASATSGGKNAGGTVTWNVPTLAVGDSAIVAVTANVGAGDTSALNNRAWVSSATPDPVLTNDSSTATTTVSKSADLAIGMTVPGTATVGQQISYKITVDDKAGPSDADSVTVTDVLPTNSVTYVSATSATGTATYDSATGTVTWSVGTLAAGGSASLTLTVTAAAAGTVSNTATVTSTTPDPNTTNNSSTAQVTVN